jgi:sugar phosphate permease
MSMTPEALRPSLALNDGQPTGVRFELLAFLAVMSLLLYVHRFAILPVTGTIVDELQVTKEQFGQSIGAFFLSYALMQVPAGWLLAAIGPRRGLTLMVLAWSIAVIALGFANSLFAFMLCRILLGVAQAGAYPAAAQMNRVWFPPLNRGKANGVVSMSGRLGLVTATATIPLLALYIGNGFGIQVGRWRYVFALLGGLGVVWSILFWIRCRDRPRVHPRCNDAELELLGDRRPAEITEFESQNAPEAPTQRSSAGKNNGGENANGETGPPRVRQVPSSGVDRTRPGETEAEEARPPIPWIALFTNRSILFLCAINALQNIGWIFLASWLPSYLTERYQPELVQWGQTLYGPAFLESRSSLPDPNLAAARDLAAWLSALTSICGALGNFSGGFVADRALRLLGRRWGRCMSGVVSGTVAGLIYTIVTLIPDPIAFAVAMCLIVFLLDMTLASLWATYQDIGGRFTGVALALPNTCGNLAAAACGWGFGYFADQKRWDIVFAASAGALLLLAVCWSFVDATRSIDPENHPDKPKS